MAMPTVQYAKTADRVRIAFHVLGKGPTVAILYPYHVNHLTLNWQVPLHRGASEYLARYFTVINLDFRGAGISEQPMSSISLDTLCEDLRAVVDSLQTERVGLCALGDAALIACHFASLWPARSLSAVFVGAGESEMNRRVLSLRHANPNLEAHLRGALLGGLDDATNSSALSRVAREALTPNALSQWEQLLRETKLSSITPSTPIPTLWLHAENDELVSVHHAQALVNSMQNARLMTVPGKSGMDVWRDRTAVQAMKQFLADGFGAQHNFVDRQPRRRRKSNTYPSGLSEREVEVLHLVATGRTNQQISEDLFISLNTVAYHLRSIFNKTGAANRTEASAFAHSRGLFIAIK
jgi:DNA-binding CsgD family transcriptional regulator/pimeloyl-ACP methyl ester carboxylesterase